MAMQHMPPSGMMPPNMGAPQFGEYARQSLEDWIDEVMREKHEEKSCTRLALMHCVQGAEAREVWACSLNGKRPSELAPIFERKARSVAQDLGPFGSGVQLFEVWAFFGDGGTPSAWHPMTIQSKMPRGVGGTEGPAGLGPDAQRMRQQEAIFGQMFAKQGHLDTQHMGLITWLGSSLMAALQENRTLARESIEWMRREQDRSHEYRMREIDAIKALAFQEKLINFAPALVNTAFGKEVFPQGTADTSMLTTIIEGLADKDPNMLAVVVGAIKDDPVVGGTFAARVAEIVKAKTDREEAREKALNAVPKGPEPEDDAAGGPVIRLVSGDKEKK
jgi:hypothetical protein